MNIQISVIIWTVICFVLLMVILKNLLFTPILQVMDRRKARISNAQLKKEQRQILLAEYEQKRLENEAALKLETENMLRKEVKRAQADGKTAIEQAREKRLSDTEDYRVSVDKEYGDIMNALQKSCENLASRFADKMISG